MQTTDKWPIVSIKNVSKFFGEFQALKDVSLDVQLGERIVVCGPSGSGKSTLIRCINRLEKHEAGSILVDNVDLNDSRKGIDSIRTNIGMVFQQFHLFPHLTVLENLMLGPMRGRKTKKITLKNPKKKIGASRRKPQNKRFFWGNNSKKNQCGGG